jgi:hypothetical protein
MVKLYEDTNIKAIANAIRAKNGTETSYKVSEMAEAIKNISAGEEKNTVTVTIFGKYNSNYCHCSIVGGDRITTYGEAVELEKTDALSIVSCATLSANASHANITLNGTVVNTGSSAYTLSLADYSEVTIVFAEQYNSKWYTCAIVAK